MSLVNVLMEQLGGDATRQISGRLGLNEDSTSKAIAGALPTIKKLVKERFGERVYLVSKCGENIERKSREWLDHNGFYGVVRFSEAAKAVGKAIGERAKKAGVETVVFDRGGHRFHGRVKALADAAREAGLKF